MGLLDSLRGLFKLAPAMRDRHADREAGRDPKFQADTPSGSVGPGGSALEGAQGAGGAIEPDPPEDRG
ncbi:MAG: hypothetical protein QOJ57_1708 [Thermoleophilaceae bacterium]|nr:hypothetical protein [Thermoleophilaceae bacterium]